MRPLGSWFGQMLIGLDQFATLSQLVFATALDPNAWYDLVSALGTCFDGCNVHFFGYDSGENSTRLEFYHGYDPQAVQDFRSYYSRINVWTPGLSVAPVGSALHSDLIVRPDELRRTEFYNDWLLPQDDISVGCGTILARSGGRFFHLGTNFRRRDQEKIESDLMRTLSNLSPLMQQSLKIQALFGIRSIESELLHAQAAASDAAVLLVDTDLRPTLCNRRAEEMLEAGRLMQLTANGKIRFLSDTIQLKLQHEVKVKRGERFGPVQVSDTQTDGYTVFAISIPENYARMRNLFLIGSRPMTAILIKQSSARTNSEEENNRLNLSRSEFSIVLDLARGLTIRDISETRGTTINTVRNQIKMAMSKAGVHRQIDLVLLITRSVPDFD